MGKPGLPAGIPQQEAAGTCVEGPAFGSTSYFFRSPDEGKLGLGFRLVLGWLVSPIPPPNMMMTSMV